MSTPFPLKGLKPARKAKGFSQEAVAAAIGVPLGTYRSWEQCQNVPRVSKAVGTLATTTEHDNKSCADLVLFREDDAK
jgi:transcriptional regulator with XRE-family HTH domain